MILSIYFSYTYVKVSINPFLATHTQEQKKRNTSLISRLNCGEIGLNVFVRGALHEISLNHSTRKTFPRCMRPRHRCLNFEQNKTKKKTKKRK